MKVYCYLVLIVFLNSRPIARFSRSLDVDGVDEILYILVISV